MLDLGRFPNNHRNFKIVVEPLLFFGWNFFTSLSLPIPLSVYFTPLFVLRNTDLWRENFSGRKNTWEISSSQQCNFKGPSQNVGNQNLYSNLNSSVGTENHITPKTLQMTSVE